MSDGASMLLVGLEGSNPLAFLAALGTVRTLALALPNESVRMGWEKHEGAWRPRVWSSLARDGDAFVKTLHACLRTAVGRKCFKIGDNLNLQATSFREHLLDAVKCAKTMKCPLSRVDADFLAAFGSEAVVNDDGTMRDTELRTMSGAGHQHFLKFFRDLVAETDADHLRRTLLCPWDYADSASGLVLRWDPADDRRHALRWAKPVPANSRTMRGANRLAIEALPLLPTVPTQRGLATMSFQRTGQRDTSLVWPIWSSGINMKVIQSLLGQVVPLLDDPRSRSARGVTSIYRSTRVTIDKYRSFTPAAPV